MATVKLTKNSPVFIKWKETCFDIGNQMYITLLYNLHRIPYNLSDKQELVDNCFMSRR